MAERFITPRTYGLVFTALIVLTAATVAIGYLPLGAWHPIVGLTIGAAKAGLVVLFFMHVIHSSRLIQVIALGGLLWLAILMTYTLTDYLSRPDLPVPGR